MTAPLDPRLNAFRADLAAESLRSLIEAPAYAAGEPARVIRPVIPLRQQPAVSESLANEVLFGELVRIFDVTNGWAWVQLDRDRYVGYVPADALARETPETTHRVSALGTFVYPAADIKAPPLMHLSMNSEIAVAATDERFATLKTGGYVIARHIQERGRPSRDFAEIAERFIGTPYLWGGRSRLGVDCSGLLQLACHAVGLKCPRDSDMQRAELGSDVLIPADLDGLVRGDLICWAGHIGVMVDGVMLLHANAYHMAVAVETLHAAVDRIAKSDSRILAIKRLGQLGA